MTNNVSTLLLRNLSDVFAEIDPVRRRKAIDEIWHEDGVFYDPNSGPHRGRDEIDRVAGKVKATHPTFRYQPISAPEEIGDGRRGSRLAGAGAADDQGEVLAGSAPFLCCWRPPAVTCCTVLP